MVVSLGLLRATEKKYVGAVPKHCQQQEKVYISVHNIMHTSAVQLVSTKFRHTLTYK